MSFDPYHVWLSIPPNEQPPNHYRLLGIPLYEANLDVIESAADRQMQYLRTFQSGPNSVASQRLLNEVSTAKICLLTPAKKQQYDQQLRVKLTPPPAPAAPAVPIAPAVRPVMAQHSQGVAGEAPAGPIIVAPSEPVTVGRNKAKSSPLLAVWISLVAIAALVLAVVWFKSNEPAPIAAGPPKPNAPEVPPAPAPPAAKPPASSPNPDPSKVSPPPVKPVEPKPPAEQPVAAPQVADLPLRSTIPPSNVPEIPATPSGNSGTQNRKRLSVPDEAALTTAVEKLDAAHSEEVKAAKTQPQKRAGSNIPRPGLAGNGG